MRLQGEEFTVERQEELKDLQKENKQLQQQIEDMKCCGNCNCREPHKNRKRVDCREYCLLYGKFAEANKYCSEWQSDSLTRKEREV
jgi:hypothetical protein